MKAAPVSCTAIVGPDKCEDMEAGKVLVNLVLPLNTRQLTIMGASALVTSTASESKTDNIGKILGRHLSGWGLSQGYTVRPCLK